MALSITANKCNFDSYEVTITSPVEPGGGDHIASIDFGDAAMAYALSIKLEGVAIYGGCSLYFTSAGESYTLEVKSNIENSNAAPVLKWTYTVHGLYAPVWADVKGEINIVLDFTSCCNVVSPIVKTQYLGTALVTSQYINASQYYSGSCHYTIVPSTPVSNTTTANYTFNIGIAGWTATAFNKMCVVVATTAAGTITLTATVTKPAGSNTVTVVLNGVALASDPGTDAAATFYLSSPHHCTLQLCSTWGIYITMVMTSQIANYYATGCPGLASLYSKVTTGSIYLTFTNIEPT